MIPTITWLYLTVSLKRDTDPGGRRFKSCPRYQKNPVSQRKVAEIPGFIVPKMARGARKRGLKEGLKDKKSWSEPDLSALRCEKVWFKVVGGQL